VCGKHKLVVADFRFKIRLQRNKHNKVTRTKWWKLKGDVAQTFKERASEEFGLSQGNRREVKDTWWWNEDVQKAIKEKKDCYKRLHHDKCADNIEKYRIAKKSAKPMTTFINGWTQSRDKRISIGWPRFVKGRQGMSTKSNASRMKQTNY
jgi:hypothetical protein